MANERKFRVITNENLTENRNTDHDYEKEHRKSYLTNPLKIQGQSLKEDFLRYNNNEGGRRFTVEDLLRGC